MNDTHECLRCKKSSTKACPGSPIRCTSYEKVPDLPNLDDSWLLEKLAALEYDRWARWMKYLLSKCSWVGSAAGLVAVIPPEPLRHWQRLIDTKYADLSEEEKEGDRVEARKTLALLAAEAAKHPVGCLLLDGHEGPCVEAKWEASEKWTVARPTSEWTLNVDAHAAWEQGFYWYVVHEGSANDDAITGYAPTVEAAKAKAEAVLRALLSVPGGL